MNIHIICREDGHIIPRLMFRLASYHGWTVSPFLRRDADIRYFAPYYVAHEAHDGGGKTAAWFTHRENVLEMGAKYTMWGKIAGEVDMAIITAKMWQEELPAKTMTQLVTPGVETGFLTPALKPIRHKVVGVSGAGSYRKGIDLVQRLYIERSDIDLRASGQGWGIESYWVNDWWRMSEFYRTLQVLLCASTIEGVPMPPLEALSCGVKVVVPRGVGCMDGLPEMQGIRHFDTGDYDDMVRALDLALEDNHNPERLRAEVVGKFDMQAWYDSHLTAFEVLLNA